MSVGRYKEYPKYRDSGIEWVGDIPAGWGVKPLLAVADSRAVKNDDGKENNVLSLSYGNIIRRDVDENFGLLPESFNTYQLVASGDIILRLTDLQNDKRSLRVGRANENGIITSAYLKLSAKADAIESRYLYQLLHSYDTTKVFYGMGGGLRQSMKFDDMRRLDVLIPPLPEQTQIAAFLDYETAKIDQLIEKQQALISLLKEKRQAVISHAVTKGLNPQAPLKDSGIEWLGQVPAHWKTSRLKHATSRIVDCPHETPTLTDDGEYMTIRTSDIEEGKIFPAQMRRVDKREYLNRIRREALFKDDVVYSREGGRWGHAALVPYEDRFCLGQRMMQFRANGEFVPQFLMWHLNANNVYAQGDIDTVGSASPHVNVETICNYRITAPCFAEQVNIAEYIGRQTEKHDRLNAEAQDAITLLQERRTALISAAVTGKIDVRHWQPSIPSNSQN